MAAHRRTSSMDSNPEWDTRADVLYHFYAYHYFAPKSTGLDLINLTDADVQFYNRIADMTRGLTSQYKLAQYLQTHHELCQTTITTLANALPNSTLTPPAGGENGYRFEFLSHVQDYNSTVEPRKRFYLLSLTATDIEFLRFNTITSSATDKQNGVEEGKGLMLRVASDGITDDGVPANTRQNPELEREEDDMKKSIQRSLAEYMAKVDQDVLVNGYGHAGKCCWY